MTQRTLTALGGAGTVTGSKFLLANGAHRVLVDCGLFQGLKELRLRNWDPLPVDLEALDAVIVTHGHLDHCGYLPRLVHAGYRGPIYATADTARLMGVVLPDSARLLAEEAHFANRHGFSRHRPALALYSEDDVEATLRQVETVEFGLAFQPAASIEARFDVAGHILGSATVRLVLDGLGGPGGSGPSARPTVVRCSGDLGRPNHPLLRPPEPVGDADWVVVESTYGDREHVDDDPTAALADVIERTVERGGMVLIPAFAVDRTEVLLLHLADLARSGRLPRVPVYVDSPMALAALSVYRRALAEGSADLRPELHGRSHLFDVPGLEEVHDVEGSKRVSGSSHSAIVIAGSGMATGGRIVHHLERFLGDRRSSVVLVGYQAAGTRGRTLLDGADMLKLNGRYVPVRAEICDLTGFSVHADRSELLDWLGTAAREPEGVFVVHGEPSAAASLRNEIRTRLDWPAAVPHHGEHLRL